MPPNTSTAHTLQNMTRLFDRARQLYEVACQAAAQGKHYPPGPWIVAKNVSPELFDTWFEHQEQRWHLALDIPPGRVKGTVLLYGDPSPVHEFTAGALRDMIFDEITGALPQGVKASRFIKSASSPRYTLLNGGRKEPDMAIKPKGTPAQTVAALVGEVAYRNEDLLRLRAELRDWTAGQTMARLCIGVLIYDRTRSYSTLNPRLLFLWKRRGQNTQLIDFGKDAHPPCVQPNMPQYRFTIPLVDIFGAHIPAPLNNVPSISLDLYDLKTSILEEL